MLLLSISVYITAYFGLLVSSFVLLTFFSNRDRLKDPVPKQYPFVSFVIPAYNDEKAIGPMIKSLLDLDYPNKNYEIIVVDDGSTDNTYKNAKKFESSRVRVFTKENGGCAHALNFGLSKARGELIARFDSDTVLAKDSLSKTIGYFDDAQVMSVTASLNVDNHKGFLQKIQWAEYLTGIFLRKIFDLSDAIHCIAGPLSVYRSEFFKKHGGFDETNITEDTEMAMRIQSHGYKIKNSIGANVFTIIPTKFWALMTQRIRWYTGFLRNAWEYKHLFNRKRKDDLSLFILPSALISVLVGFLSFFVFAYYTIRGMNNELLRMSAVGFNLDMFRNFSMSKFADYASTYFTGPFIFFLISGILIATFYFVFVKYVTGEKRGIFTAVVLFFIIYSFLYALWWGYAIYYTITGKKIRWGKRQYIRGRMINQRPQQ